MAWNTLRSRRDGSFQVTPQELSTILRHDHKPVIFLINNGGYTIERGYLGKDAAYNVGRQTECGDVLALP